MNGPADRPQLPLAADVRAMPVLLRLLPWAVLLGALVVTYVLWGNARQSALDTLHADFEFRTEELLTHLQGRLKSYEQVLLGTAGLFGASERVERAEFRTYVATLQLERSYPGIQGVGFAQLVRAAELPDHVAALRAEGFSDYTVHPPGERDPYTSIVFLEPFNIRNRRAFAFDMFSEPVRRAAMLRAWEEGTTALSGKVRLVQETGNDLQSGFLMYVPIYRNGAAHDTAEARRAGLLGWAYAPFRMHDFMAGLLGQHLGENGTSLDLEIYEGGSPTADGLMYDSDGSIGSGQAKAAGLFNRSGRVAFGGETWTVEVHSRPGFEARLETEKPRFIAAAGVGGSLLLALVIWLLVHGRANAIALAVRMNRRLTESEERFRLLFEHSLDAVLWTEPDGKILGGNPAACAMLGYRAGELGQVRRDALMDTGDPRLAALLAERRRTGRARGEVWMRRRDGTRFEAEISSAIYTDGQGREKASVVVRDISDRKRAEAELHETRERLRFAMEGAGDGVWDWDIPSGQTHYSRRWKEMVGYAEEEFENSAEAWRAAIHPDDRPGVEAALEAYFAGRAQGFAVEFRMRCKDGGWKWILGRGMAVSRDAGGRPRRMIGTHTDISRLKEIEADLMRLNDTLEQRVREEVAKNMEQERLLIHQSRLAAMGEMIGNIAHQWRQPINALSLLLANLKDAREFGELTAELLDAEVEKGMRLMQKMSTTIDDFRNFFRPDKEKRPFAPVRAVEETLALMEHALRNHAVEVRLEGDPALTVVGYPNEFSQVLVNLITNARDALVERKVADARILVTVDRVGERVEVRVRDNAGGIAPEVLPRVFDPYFTTKEKGTGIGLYMSKMIIEHMDGTIGARNVEDGAEFIMGFPLSEPLPSRSAV